MTTKIDMNLIESILETISKAKAVEDGRLSVEEMVGATERDEDPGKVKHSDRHNPRCS